MLDRKVLHSWKDIAQYTGRGIRTLQRYEARLSFPVHRPAGKSHAAVLAFPDEIDAWLHESPKGHPLTGDHPGAFAKEQIENRRVSVAVRANAQHIREIARVTRESCLKQSKRLRMLIQHLKECQEAFRRHAV